MQSYHSIVVLFLLMNSLILCACDSEPEEEEEATSTSNNAMSASIEVDLPEIDTNQNLSDLLTDDTQVQLLCETLEDQTNSYIDEYFDDLQQGLCDLLALANSEETPCKETQTECLSTEIDRSMLNSCDPDALSTLLGECNASLDLYLTCVNEGLSLVQEIGSTMELDCDSATIYGLTVLQKMQELTACTELQMQCPEFELSFE